MARNVQGFLRGRERFVARAGEIDFVFQTPWVVGWGQRRRYVPHEHKLPLEWEQGKKPAFRSLESQAL